jgi:hypothetical protein
VATDETRCDIEQRIIRRKGRLDAGPVTHGATPRDTLKRALSGFTRQGSKVRNLQRPPNSGKILGGWPAGQPPFFLSREPERGGVTLGVTG